MQNVESASDALDISKKTRFTAECTRAQWSYARYQKDAILESEIPHVMS